MVSFNRLALGQSRLLLIGVIAMELLSKEAVRAMTLIGHTKREELEGAGLFPKKIPLGPFKNSRVAYLRSEVEQWIADQVARRDAREDLS